MVWNIAGPKTVELPVPDGRSIIAVDMLGHSKPLTVTKGKVYVEIGPCPVYVVMSD